LSKSWPEWVVENFERNCDPNEIVRVLLDNKFTVPDIRQMMGDRFPQHSPHINDDPVSQMINMGPIDANHLHRKRTALLATQCALASLAPSRKTIERRRNVSRVEFLEQYYALNRPVILCGMMEGWQAMTKWTPEYLKSVCGEEMVEIMAARETNPLYEMQDKKHRRNVRFSEFVDMVVSANESNDYYITARNDFFGRPGTKALLKDMVMFPEYLNNDNPGYGVFLWFGPKGTITPLHHDPMNIFMAQVQGRKQIKIIPSNEIDLIYNHYSVYSQVDISNPDYDKFPNFRQATVIDLELAPGEVLFLPVGWWHYVKALDRSMTVSFINFIFPNDHEYK